MRISVQTTLSDYELHRSFVGIAGKQTYASRYLCKHLDQKYRAAIRHFAKAQDDAELKKRWDEAVASGDIGGAYWALVSHPEASDALVDRVYGEVHMLSHLAGAAVRVDMEELHRLRRQARTLVRQLTDIQRKTKAQITERDNTIRRLSDQLTQTEGATRDLEVARKQLAALETDPALRQRRDDVEKLATMLTAEQLRAQRAAVSAETWERIAIEKGGRNLYLESQLAEVHAERDVLEATLEKLLTPDCSSCATQEDCLGSINLLGRCILYVGGRSRQCAHFRSLVERQNGQFIHHDGGLHGGRSRLSSILPQADVVLCPLDCVSHDAAHRVKQFCKHHRKRLVLLPRSSLAAFARGLNELVA